MMRDEFLQDPCQIDSWQAISALIFTDINDILTADRDISVLANSLPGWRSLLRRRFPEQESNKMSFSSMPTSSNFLLEQVFVQKLALWSGFGWIIEGNPWNYILSCSVMSPSHEVDSYTLYWINMHCAVWNGSCCLVSNVWERRKNWELRDIWAAILK